MSQQVINIGTTANDGTGDPLRTAWQKTNENFTEIYVGKCPIAGPGSSQAFAVGAVAAAGSVSIAQASAAFLPNQLNAYSNGNLYITGGTNGLMLGATIAGTARMFLGYDIASASEVARFETNAVERMRITSGGNVIIGTTTDDGVGKLQVNGSARITGTPSYTLLLQSSDTYSQIVSGQAAVGYNQLQLDTRSCKWLISNIEKMLLSESGNLLIGTTTDDGVNKLQVNGGVSLLTWLDIKSANVATSATAGVAAALPSNPAGYLTIRINGTSFKIPYYYS